MSPDAFVERYGEPDEWRHEGQGSRLTMTAVWRCLDGEYREVVWRTANRTSDGVQYWNVVRDVTREGDCGSGNR